MADGIIITRIFDAPKEKVWQAWTDSELVKKWWGPEGFTAPSIKIDLRVGGKHVYCMHGPEGTPWDKDMYSAGIFEEIVTNEKIVTSDYFSDSEGNKADPIDYGMSPETPKEMKLIVSFEDMDGGKTKLTLEYPKPESDAAFEAMKNSGMEEGWGTSLDKLAEALK